MIWLIAFFFASYNIACAIFNDSIMAPHSFIDWGFSVFMWFLGSLGAIIVCAGGALLIGLLFETTAKLDKSYNLTTLRIKDGLEGNFYLGSGHIEAQQYYFFYRENDDHSVTPDKIEADKSVRIYEQDMATAKIEIYSGDFVSSAAWFFGAPSLKGKPVAKIYVPKGSIKVGYTI